MSKLGYNYIGLKAAHDNLLYEIRQQQGQQDKEILELSGTDIRPLILHFKNFLISGAWILNLKIQTGPDPHGWNYLLAYPDAAQCNLYYSHSKEKERGYKAELLDIYDTFFVDLLDNSDKIERKEQIADMRGQAIQLQKLIENWSENHWGKERQALAVYRLLVAYVLLEYIKDHSRFENTPENVQRMEEKLDNGIKLLEEDWEPSYVGELNDNLKDGFLEEGKKIIKQSLHCVDKCLTKVEEFLSKELADEVEIVRHGLKLYDADCKYKGFLTDAQNNLQRKNWYGADNIKKCSRIKNLLQESKHKLTQDEFLFILDNTIEKEFTECKKKYTKAYQMLTEACTYQTTLNQAIENVNQKARAAAAKQAPGSTESFVSMKESGDNLPQESGKGSPDRQIQPTGVRDIKDNQAAGTRLAGSSVQGALGGGQYI